MKTINWNNVTIIDGQRGRRATIHMVDGETAHEGNSEVVNFLPCTPPMRAFVLAKRYALESPPDGVLTDVPIPALVVGWKHNISLDLVDPVLAGLNSYAIDTMRGDSIFILDPSGRWMDDDADAPRYMTPNEVYRALSPSMGQHDQFALSAILGVET